VLADELHTSVGTNQSFAFRNPLGSAVAMAALEVLVEERLAERADRLGQIFRDGVRAIQSPLIQTVRGRGLLNAVVIDESKSKRGRTAWQLCLLLKERGVLAKPTHVNTFVFCSYPFRITRLILVMDRIRFAPPLVIDEADLKKVIKVLADCLCDLDEVCSNDFSVDRLLN
jgi:ornithine--oxo-acid transaminase